MDELQATFINGRIFIWGISSRPEEIFTPIARLEKAYSELFKAQSTVKKTSNIEITATANTPLVPPSMKLFYNQFSIKNASKKTFSITGIEADGQSILYNFLHQEKRHGILFGDSYEFFRMCLKFSFSLALRQRFVPYCKGKQSRFLLNLDNADDYETFRELLKKAPLSIKPNMPDETEDVLKEALEYLVNLIISFSLEGTHLNLRNETETDKWLNGLFGQKAIVSEAIQQGLKEWLVMRKVNLDLEYNMLFKLEEPAEEGREWLLTFNVQSKKDPSLLISLNEIWRNPSRLPIKNSKIHMLRDLGTAGTVSKMIEKALYKPNPYKISLSDEEAVGFIARDSFLLKDIGYVVHVPKITSARTNSFKVRVRLKDSSKFKVEGTGYLGTALFDFDYSVAIGDIEVSKEEFYELSNRKEKLIKVKGKWVEINEKDMKKLVDYFEKKKKISLHDTFSLNTSEETGFEIDDVIVPKHFEAEIKGLFSFKDISQVGVPDTLLGTLRPYQKLGFSWLLFLRNLGFGGILADDMGLGKTIQTLAYLLQSREKPSLVICPTSVLGNWERELKKFSPSLKVHLHYGPKRLKKEQFKKRIKGIDLVISSYAIARGDEETFSSIMWSNVILDEAQNIKNPYTKQAISINKLKSKNRFCLTGTPIENRLSELWSIMNFTNPGFLSSWKNFKKNFAEIIELQNDQNKTDLLKKIISPFILRRLKTDKEIIRDLPIKTEIKEYCTLTKEQASLYQAIVDDSLKAIKDGSEKRRALIMAALIKLKQVCNHPSNYLKDGSSRLSDRSGKVARLRELVDTFLQNNEKCLIFTQYKEMGDLLKKDLEEYFDIPVCFLHGQQNQKKREQLINHFQSDSESSPKIFVLSLKAGGLGINLTKASQVIHFDRWWNPAVENQATDRAFRIGQKKDVFVYKFITTGTVEEKIDAMIERKLYLSDSLLSKAELAITELDDKQLRELFSLREESIGG
ncbi:MAG: DEAD/DEAH box helicase [Candidatus Woesearchaeota archaeon]